MSEVRFDTDHWDKWVARHGGAGDMLALYPVISNYFRHGNRLRVSGANRLMQCLILPSFEPWISYELFKQPFKPLYYLFKIVCKLPDPKISELVPDLTYLHSEISENKANDVLQLFNKGIPAYIPRSHFGADGTSYELGIGDSFWGDLSVGVRYRWWVSPPEGWQVLHDAMMEAIDIFEGVLE